MRHRLLTWIYTGISILLLISALFFGLR